MGMGEIGAEKLCRKSSAPVQIVGAAAAAAACPHIAAAAVAAAGFREKSPRHRMRWRLCRRRSGCGKAPLSLIFQENSVRVKQSSAHPANAVLF